MSNVLSSNSTVLLQVLPCPPCPCEYCLPAPAGSSSNTGHSKPGRLPIPETQATCRQADAKSNRPTASREIVLNKFPTPGGLKLRLPPCETGRPCLRRLVLPTTCLTAHRSSRHKRHCPLLVRTGIHTPYDKLRGRLGQRRCVCKLQPPLPEVVQHNPNPSCRHGGQP